MYMVQGKTLCIMACLRTQFRPPLSSVTIGVGSTPVYNHSRGAINLHS
jgi:hypothetical protein